MVLSNVRIFTIIGIQPVAKRDAVIADFLSAGLEGLRHMTPEDVKDACNGYARRQDGEFPIQLTVLQRQRLKGLVLWVRDRDRVQQPLEFGDGTSAADLNAELAAALERDEMRREQKRAGESYLDHQFINKLKSQSQWDKFSEELEATLGMIVGSQGVTINYVIRKDEESNYDAELEYNEAAVLAVKVTGPKFKVDAKTVHQIILNNVAEDSDAYTYIKPLLKYRDGRKDIEALRERYDNDASRQAVINTAKATLENLRFKSERSFSFEKFSARLQKAYDDLENNGRKVHNGDIVDALWPRIQDSSLQTYVASLKVDYSKEERNYKVILRDIAAEVAKTKNHVTFAPGTRGVSVVYKRDGNCPKNGVHMPDGSLYIGNYTTEQWRSAAVRPHHKEILEARRKDAGGNGGKGDGKRQSSAIKNSRRKLKKLKAKIASVEAKVASLSSNSGTKVKDSDESRDDASTNANAGDSFGGKRSRQGGS